VRASYSNKQYRSAVCFIEGRRCVRPTAKNNTDQRCSLFKGVGVCVVYSAGTVQISGVLYFLFKGPRVMIACKCNIREHSRRTCVSFSLPHPPSLPPSLPLSLSLSHFLSFSLSLSLFLSLSLSFSLSLSLSLSLYFSLSLSLALSLTLSLSHRSELQA